MGHKPSKHSLLDIHRPKDELYLTRFYEYKFVPRFWRKNYWERTCFGDPSFNKMLVPKMPKTQLFHQDDEQNYVLW